MSEIALPGRAPDVAPTPRLTQSRRIWARRCTSRGRSPTNATSPACTASRRAGPARPFATSSMRRQVFRVLEQMMDLDIPYLSFSGGEPMLHPQFFAMVEYVLRARRAAQDRNQRPLPHAGKLRAPRGPRRQGGAGQPRRRLARDLQPHPRARRVRHWPCPAFATCAMPACRSRSTFRRRGSTCMRSARSGPRPRARRLQLLYRPHDVHRQCGQGVAPPRSVRRAIRGVLRYPARQGRWSTSGRMRVYFHEAGLLEELRYRLQHPAALIIVLPNGLVKLVNAHAVRVRRPSPRLARCGIWANFQRAWRDPRVARFVDALAADPGATRTLHQWVHL